MVKSMGLKVLEARMGPEGVASSHNLFRQQNISIRIYRKIVKKNIKTWLIMCVFLLS